MALCALVFLRMVDIAVFDAEHAHVESTHVQEHASEMSHDHDAAEESEHESLGAMSAHVCIHTLVSTFLDTNDMNVGFFRKQTSSYGLHVNEAVKVLSFRPPVPPPLA